VQLEPRLNDLAIGRVRRLTITATPQLPFVQVDDTELGTLGTQWVQLVERGIKHLRFEVQTQDGDKNFSAWRPPTRIAGAASTVKGGVLGPLAMEHDITLDAKGRLVYIVVRHFVENNDEPIYLPPFPFDPDSEPTIVSLEVVGTVIKVLGDSDVASFGVYSTSLSYAVEYDGQSAMIDVAGPGNVPGFANVGLPPGGFTDTFYVRAFKKPIVEMPYGLRWQLPTPPNICDERYVTIRNASGGGGAPAATIAELSAYGPPDVGSHVITIAFRATAAPAGWTAKVFIKDQGASEVDETSNLTPALSTPPIVSTSYNWSAAEARSTPGIGAPLITLTVRAELLDGLSNIMDSKTVSVSYYAATAFY
jgi:hypothetical protein